MHDSCGELAEPPRGEEEGKRDYGTYEIAVVEADGAEVARRAGGLGNLAGTVPMDPKMRHNLQPKISLD